MTLWQKDVQERRRIRAAVADLEKQAVSLDDPSSESVHQARVYLSGRRVEGAMRASFDLSYAVDQCSDSSLRAEIEKVRQSLDRLLYQP